jgi:hypothetical protein
MGTWEHVPVAVSEEFWFCDIDDDIEWGREDGPACTHSEVPGLEGTGCGWRRMVPA